MDAFDTLSDICETRHAGDGRLRLSPANADQLSAVLSTANRHHLPLSAEGAGCYRWMDGAHEHTPLLLDMRRISGVLDYQPEDMTLTALAGTPVGEIQQLAGENGQELAVDTDCPKATIGGLFACGWNGLRSRSLGLNRDKIIGMEAMLPDGSIFQSGGKVVKNVTGYDLTRLLAGAHGTLGLFTQLSVRLTPAPRQRRMLLWPYAHLQTAAQDLFNAGQKVRLASCGAIPSSLIPTIGDSSLCDAEVLGWAIIDDGPLAIRELTSRLFRLLGKALFALDGGERLDAAWGELLAAPRSFLDQQDGMTEIGYPPAAGAEVLECALQGSNNGIVYADRGVSYTRCRMDYPEPVHQLREDLKAFDAHLQFRGNGPEGLDYHGEISAWPWLQKLKKELDPQHILNPGHGVFRAT